MIIEVFAFNLLQLKQVVETNLKVVSAESHLDLHDNVRINLHVVQVKDILYLQHNATVAKTIAVQAESVLTLSQETQPRVHNVEAVNHLHLWHEAKHEDQWPSVFQILTLTHVAEAVVARGAYDTLVLTQEATYTISRNVSAGNNLALNQAARVYKPDKYFINDPSLTVEAP